VVRAVASEPRDALVRVELEVDPASARVPLEHGLPGRAEIEIERIAPAVLVLRAAGAWVQSHASER
jgi:membrane fusion protein (multidrug efflux system)